MKGITVVKKRPDCYRSTHTWNVQILSAEFSSFPSCLLLHLVLK